MDTDLHKLTKTTGGYTNGFAPIRIGCNNWFGNGSLIMKRTETPDFCIISARTILSGKVDMPEYSVIGQKRDIKLMSLGVWRNIDDDIIDFNADKDVLNSSH